LGWFEDQVTFFPVKSQQEQKFGAGNIGIIIKPDNSTNSKLKIRSTKQIRNSNQKMTKTYARRS
jgi:hypothetical protein